MLQLQVRRRRRRRTNTGRIKIIRDEENDGKKREVREGKAERTFGAGLVDGIGQLFGFLDAR